MGGVWVRVGGSKGELARPGGERRAGAGNRGGGGEGVSGHARRPKTESISMGCGPDCTSTTAADAFRATARARIASGSACWRVRRWAVKRWRGVRTEDAGRSRAGQEGMG